VCKPGFGYFTPVPQCELTRKDASLLPSQSADTSDIEEQALREPAHFEADVESVNYGDYHNDYDDDNCYDPWHDREGLMRDDYYARGYNNPRFY
jgi:hypothetical protein